MPSYSPSTASTRADGRLRPWSVGESRGPSPATIRKALEQVLDDPIEGREGVLDRLDRAPADAERWPIGRVGRSDEAAVDLEQPDVDRFLARLANRFILRQFRAARADLAGY